MECLDANAVQDLMSGALDTTARARAAAHLDGCEDCRGLVSLLAKDATQDAARATLRKTDIGLQKTEDAVVDIKALHTVASDGKPANRPTPDPLQLKRADPLGVTADVSLIQQSGTRQIGRTFGKYKIVDRIGAGAMGVVYRAEDPALNRKVALKLLHKPDKSLAQRLVREAQSMAQVNHPNVCQVYDAAQAEGDLTYIAMEYVQGASLRTWQQQKRPIPEIIEAYVAAGRGLAAAHDAGIIHRDFKPDNCLIGADGRVRVTDFGLASARPSDDGADSPEELELTNSGMVLGTPAYMAPEQFTGGNVDPRTDQFNYCVALYEALYGERPFKGKSFDELGDNVCDGKLRKEPAGTRVPRTLRAILIRGLAVRPGDRYPTMNHLLDELGRDRARAWRLTAFVAAAFAALLGIGLFADWVVRDRISSQNSQLFQTTGKQIDRAFGVVANKFDVNANQMYFQSTINDVRGYRDESEFGISTPEDDFKRLLGIHEQLGAQDWSSWTMGSGQAKEEQVTVAIGDLKGRLVYTRAPDTKHEWTGLDNEGKVIVVPDKVSRLEDIPKIRGVSWIDKTYKGLEKTMVLQRTDDPKFRATNLLGDNPGYELAFCFARVLVGSGEKREVQGALIQAVNAKVLIPDIRLDEDMKLAIVSVDGKVHVGDEELAQPLIDAAGDEVVEVTYNGRPYQVKRQPLRSLEQRIADAALRPSVGDKPVGYVVMAQELGGVLSGLFPGARMVFAFAALAALALAIATTLRARAMAR